MNKLITSGKKRWTDAEIQELKQIAKGKTRKELAAHFRVTESSMVACLKNRKINTGRDTRFKKGSIPWSKGKKLPAEMITEAMRSTWFKKGSLPHNTSTNGEIRTRKMTGTKQSYKWIRLSLNKWELLHRYNYKKAVGPIPDNYMVTFKDGNSLNCDPSNLKLESIQEHMSRNTIARFDPQLRSAIHLLSKFKRKLKAYEKQD